MKKRIFSILLAAAMLLSLLPSAAVKAQAAGLTVDDINTSEMFFRQSTGGTCTLTASAMLVRRAARLNGNPNWPSVTEASLRSTAWVEGVGMSWNFSYAGITVSHGNVTGVTEDWMKNMLRSHPEGIVIYNKNKPHAVLVTDYTAGKFYCADPAFDYGRIPLTASILPGSNDAQILSGLSAYWYVTYPSLRVEGGAVRDSAVTILSQPASQRVPLGDYATFRISASGSNLSYQWQYKSASASEWVNSANATANSDTLLMEAASSRHGMQFRCIVRDSAGNSATSAAATLTVYAELAIKAHPKDVSTSLGKTAKFTVTAYGVGLSYQWQYKSASSAVWTNSAASSAKKATLSLTADATRQGMRFRCIVKDADGNSILSNEAALTILPEITAQPVSVFTTLGTTEKFTVTASGTGLTYQWQYKSASASAWTNSAASSAKKATLSMAADSTRSGMQFRCIVKDSAGHTLTSSPATMTIKAAITSQPKNVTLALGTTGKFSVTAVGTGLTYQWQYKSASATVWTNSASSTAKTAALKMTADSTRSGMQFRCIVKDSTGNTVTSAPATMTIKAAITAQPKNVTLALGETGKFSVAAVGNGLTYQWQYKSASGTEWKNSGNSTAKTATLSMTADSTRQGMKFRCIVTDQYGNIVTSAAAAMTIK